MRREQYTQTARFVIWAMILSMGVLLYLDTSPVHLADPAPEPASIEAPKLAGGEVLIVVDSGAIRRSAEEERWGALDFSWAWVNTIEQEVGPCTVIERSALTTTELGAYRFIIVTHAAAQQEAGEEVVTRLGAFASSGGVVVLERPGAGLRAAFSADGSGGTHVPVRITRVDGLPSPLDAELQAVPLMTSFVGSGQPAQGARTFLAMDGVPVIYGVPRSTGAVITVEFDYGRQLVGLQQGVPADDFSVPDRYNLTAPPLVEAMDLVASESLLNTPIPAADLLERFMVHGVMGAYQPVVGLWPFRGGAQGALIMSHGEAEDAEATWMARWEHEHQHDATVFMTVPSNLPRSEVARLQEIGADVELLWHRPEGRFGLFEEVGLGGLHPLARPVTLEQQTKRLNEHFKKRRTVRAARIWGGVWGPRWDDPFRELHQVEIPLDSSLGPRAYGRGYLFGTGLPYRTLSREGVPIPVWEMPIVLDLNPDHADAAFLRELITRSRDDHHQAITVAFDPSTWQVAPSLALFDLWQASFTLASDHLHWTTNLPRFHRFWLERLKAQLRVRARIELPSSVPDPIDPAERLEQPPAGDEEGAGEEEVPVAPPDLRTPEQAQVRPPQPSLVLALEVKADGEGHAVRVPATLQGRTFQEVRVVKAARGLGGAAEPPGRPIPTTLIGLPHMIIPLKKGVNGLEVIYR
jgi:hypothetical protein